MSDSDPPSPPAQTASSRISDRAALEAAIAGAAGLLLGRVLLGRGAGLLAGTAAVAARLFSEARKTSPGPANPAEAASVASPPGETSSGQSPSTPEPSTNSATASVLAGLTASQEEPVEVEDIGILPEAAVSPEISFPMAESSMGGGASRPAEEMAGGPAEVIFVELPPVEPVTPLDPAPSVPMADAENASLPLPAFPAWEAIASGRPPDSRSAQSLSSDAPGNFSGVPPAETAPSTSPLPVLPEPTNLTELTDSTDPEAIWKMAAAESAPVPVPETEGSPRAGEAAFVPAPADNPFASLFASSPEPTPGPPALTETTPNEETVAAAPESAGVPLEVPVTASPPKSGSPESKEFLTISTPADFIGTSPDRTAPEAITTGGPQLAPDPAARSAPPLPPSPEPEELPILSLKVPAQVPAANPAPGPAQTGPNVTAPVEVVDAAAMESLGTPPPRQAGSPQPVATEPPRRSSWRAWFWAALLVGCVALAWFLVARLAGGGALFDWSEKQKSDSPPSAAPIGGSSAPLFPPLVLPPPDSTAPPHPAAPAVPAPPPAVPAPAQSKPDALPISPPAVSPQPAVPANPPPAAEPAAGVSREFAPGSPEAIARQTLETLLAAKSVKELEPLVHQPAEALRLANAYFPDGNLKPAPYQRILFDAVESLPGTGFKSHLFRVVTESTPLGFPVAVEDTKEGPRVDFDAFVQCRDRLLDAFMANRSALPGRFLVVLRRGHYFGEDLPKEVLDRLLCLEVSSPIPEAAKHLVFIPRSTELGKLAHRKFAWDQVYTPVVELSHSGTYVSLNAILQDNWQRTRR